MEQVEHERGEQCRFGFLPERVRVVRVFRRGVFDEVVDQTEHIRILANVVEWIVIIRFRRVDKVKNAYLVSLAEQQRHDRTRDLTLWVSDDVAGVRKVNVRLDDKPRFTGTGAADDHLQQIAAVLAPIQSHLQMLGQNDIVLGLLVPIPSV